MFSMEILRAIRKKTPQKGDHQFIEYFFSLSNNENNTRLSNRSPFKKINYIISSLVLQLIKQMVNQIKQMFLISWSSVHILTHWATHSATSHNRNEFNLFVDWDTFINKYCSSDCLTMTFEPSATIYRTTNLCTTLNHTVTTFRTFNGSSPSFRQFKRHRNTPFGPLSTPSLFYSWTRIRTEWDWRVPCF